MRSGRQDECGPWRKQAVCEAQLYEQPSTTAVGAGGLQLCWGLRLHWGLLGPACLASTCTGRPGAGHALHVFSLLHFPPLLVPLPFTTVAYFHSVLFLSPLSLVLYFSAFFPLLFPPLPSSRVAQQSFDHFFRKFSPQKLPAQF